jgi:hypothetical protein
MSALTSVIVNKDYSLIQKRTSAFDRVNMRVGNGQVLVGHPTLRNANYKPIDVLYQEARMSNTPRIGESMALPDRRLTPGQMNGEGFFKDLAGAFKQIGREVKKKKLISKAGKIIGDVASVGSSIAAATGRPELAGTLSMVGKTSRDVGKTAKTIGLGGQKVGRSGNPLVMKGNGLAQDIAMTRGLARGIGGSEKLTFVATHPLNYKQARLGD